MTALETVWVLLLTLASGAQTGAIVYLVRTVQIHNQTLSVMLAKKKT